MTLGRCKQSLIACKTPYQGINRNYSDPGASIEDQSIRHWLGDTNDLFTVLSCRWFCSFIIDASNAIATRLFRAPSIFLWPISSLTLPVAPLLESDTATGV